VKISFDPAKRDRTLAERGLDFADAARVFDGKLVTLADLRVDHGEQRFQTFGLLNDRLVMVVWTPVPGGRRIISMRKANEREQARIAAITGWRLGRSG
jgi:uncharacterized protein